MIRIRTLSLIIFLVSISSFSCLAQLEQVKGVVYYFKDGDSFLMRTDENEKLEVRVADIDCPEGSQAYGLEAKAFTMSQIQGKQITLKIKDYDRYERAICFVYYADNKNLSEELLKNGFAWHYSYYSDIESYSDLEKDARVQGLGLWQDSNPLEPWIYRKQKRKRSQNKK